MGAENEDPIRDGVFVVTEEIYHDRKVVGVTLSLQGARDVVCDLLGSWAKAKRFRWVDVNANFRDMAFSRNRGYMVAYIDDKEENFRVEWKNCRR